MRLAILAEIHLPNVLEEQVTLYDYTVEDARAYVQHSLATAEGLLIRADAVVLGVKLAEEQGVDRFADLNDANLSKLEEAVKRAWS